MNMNAIPSHSRKYMNTTPFLFRLTLTSGLAVFMSCASLTLEQVDFGWPVEARLTVSERNIVEEDRSPTTFNVAALALEEFQDSSALRGATLRMIRSNEGFYFVTGPRFKNVYVFASAPNELRLTSKVEVSQVGLRDPALNQRPPFVELVDAPSMTLRLTSDDIAEDSK